MSQFSTSEKNFIYSAAKPGGGQSFGVRRARNKRALVAALRQERLIVKQSWALPAWLGGSDAEMKLADVAAFCDQIAQLTSRGVPLVEALEVTASVVRPVCKPIVTQIRELVAAGEGFADACGKLKVFDHVTVSIFRAAERTGDIPGAAQQIATSARRQLAVKDQAVTLMIYPAIVMTISTGAVLALLMFVVPQIGAALADTGQPLPWYTTALVGLGTWMKANWLMLLGIFGGVVILLVLGRAAMFKTLGALLRRLPLMRDIVLMQESARFFSVMAAMTRAGIPLSDALAVSVEALGHPVLRGELDRMRVRLIQGGVFRTLIEQVDALPLSVRRLIIAADRAGDLETAFDTLADDLAQDVEKKTARLLAALEPALIVVMFLMIGSVLLAVMIPMLSISSSAI